MPFHIIVRNIEAEVLPKILKEFKCPKFCVSETGTSGEHWHIWLNTVWNQAKLRRELDKLREAKKKGISVRPWDDNLVYFCKGDGLGILPKVVKNDDVITQEDIELLNAEWWTTHFNQPDKDPDYVEPKLLDELVELCRDKDLDEKEVINLFITLIMQKGGKKMASIKSVGQAYIRTALLFTKNQERYKSKLYSYYSKDLF